MHVDIADVQILKVLKLFKPDPLFGKYFFSKDVLSKLSEILYKHRNTLLGIIIYEETKPEVKWNYIIHYKFQGSNPDKLPLPKGSSILSYITTNKSN